MASDSRRAERWVDWGNLGKALEASEPLNIGLNIAEIHRLRESNSSLRRAEVLPVDVWYDLRTFRRMEVPWDSEEVKGWWLSVRSSSSVIARMPLTLYDWHYLMKILMHADVSRIKHMVLGIEVLNTDDKTLAYDQLGEALRRPDFGNLQTLILYSGNDKCPSLQSRALADAIRARPGLINLRTLALPRFLDNVLFALANSSGTSHLTSFSVQVTTSEDLSALNSVFKSGCLESLCWLEIADFKGLLRERNQEWKRNDEGKGNDDWSSYDELTGKFDEWEGNDEGNGNDDCIAYDELTKRFDELTKRFDELKGKRKGNDDREGNDDWSSYDESAGKFDEWERNDERKGNYDWSSYEEDLQRRLDKLKAMDERKGNDDREGNDQWKANDADVVSASEALDRRSGTGSSQESIKYSDVLMSYSESYIVEPNWVPLISAIKSQNLPSLACLHLVIESGYFDLRGLVQASREWFASLEALHISNKRMKSEDVCSLVKVLLEDPRTELGLKSLCLPVFKLDEAAVLALLSLTDRCILPQLQELELSYKSCHGASQYLVDLVLSSVQGYLPRLKKLTTPMDVDTNPFDEGDATRLVQAYYSNQNLTADVCVHWKWYHDLSLETRFRTYRARNLRLAALREKLGGDVGELVPHMSAKVFLCGYPEVGKTTLRRALLRSLGIRTKLMWETRRVKEPRTRGIEIGRIESKRREGISLLLWDLAGQQEYHVLHGSFLTDLGFEGGKATTFVLVFKATFGSDVKDKMGYWLRFVASSSLRLVKRHVVVVLNCFNGVSCTHGDQRLWKALIANFAKVFCDTLDIHLEPFIVDVRKAAPVQPVKSHLVDHALALLHDVDVPRICLDLLQELKQWSEGQACNQLPILTWQAIEEMWKGKPLRSEFSVATLKYAASYLHEIGEIIYFDKVSNTRSGKTILVSDPEWFCRRVVGDLLLPTEMLKGATPIEVGADGSISVFMFESFFQDLLVEGVQSDDIISMLELLGLCYRRGEQEIIVPALIREDNYSSIDWEGKGSGSVMGRCLAAKDTDMNIIPVSLFRRLQVDLALDPDFGGREDSDYKVGKSFVNFKCGELLVLVQFDVDHSDPTDDRLDVLVKSAMRRDPAEDSLVQIKCICDIVQKVVDLCTLCCDGLTYDIKIIQPYSAKARTPNMNERKLMTLEHIKELLVKGKEYLAWQVDDQNVKTESVLSKAELERLVRTVQREYDDSMADAVAMGLLPKDSLYGSEALDEKSSMEVAIRDVQDVSSRSDPGDPETFTLKIFLQAMEKLEAVVRKEGRDTRQHMDKKSTELVLEFRQGHELLVKHIQAQQSFSIEEKESSVPRYMFLSKTQAGQSSRRLPEAFQRTYHLHLLCEAHFDDGFLHEVKGQEGIALTKTKEWWLKVAPWLRRSLQVGIMVGKTVGNIYLPGVFNLIPDVNLSSNSDVLATAVDKAARVLLEDDDQGSSKEGRLGSAANPLNVREKLVAQAVVKDLVGELGNTVFAQKIALKKVLLRAAAQPHAASSSAQAQPSVVWICNDCSKKYGDRAIGI